MKIFSLALVLIFSFKSLAQDFRAGFIVKLNGDSINGLINYKSDNANSKYCIFKATRKSKTEKFKPENLKKYGFIEDKNYESYQLLTPEKTKQPVFLETLVKGKVSLFKYNDIYFVKKDSLILLPKDKENEVIVNGVRYSTNDSRYKGLLNIIMIDCQLKADQINYKEKDLTNLIQNYNRCKGTVGLTFKSKKPWSKITPLALTGFDLSSVKLDGFSEYSFKQSISSFIGLGLENSFPRINEKIHFIVELWYFKKFYQGYSQTETSYGPTLNDLYIHTSFLKIPIGFQINLASEASTPYFKAGLVKYFLLKSSADILSEANSGGTIFTTDSSVSFDKKGPLGFWFGAGYQRKINRLFTCFLEGRYDSNNGFTNSSVNATSSGRTLDLILGLKF